METRIVPQNLSQVRAVSGADGVVHIPGTGIVFNQRSQKLGWFYEIIDPRALNGADLDDIVSCFNHNMVYVLGRTTNKTLTYTIDEKGFHYDAVPLPTQTIKDLVIEPIRNEYVTGSSFMFTTADNGDEWDFSQERDGVIIRYVTRIEKVFEVGPVTLPAYTQTTTDVAQRSYDAAIKAVKEQERQYLSQYARMRMQMI